MSWRQRYHYQEFLNSSLWVAPCLGLGLGLACFFLLLELDHWLAWQAPVSVDSARGVLSMLSGAMLTFIVFVLSALLLVLQLASAQLTPRIIARALQERGTHICLGIFVFAYAFVTATTTRLETGVPYLVYRISICSGLLCICVFLYLVDRLGKFLRPIAILTQVAQDGAEVIRSVYPQRIGEAQPLAAPALTQPIQELENQGRSRVLLAVHQEGLVALARQHDAVIEIVPQVGDFVVRHDPIVRVYGSKKLPEQALIDCFAFGPERTIDQDPTFALRIIVDVGSRALSPAINDPTTGVLALDQVHLLLRLVGQRHLDTGRVADGQGKVRVLLRTPNWEDFVSLGLTEIRRYGADSVQIARRMRALLEHLLKVLPEERHGPLRQRLELLDGSLERCFAEAVDRQLATEPDLQGLGGSSAA